MASPKRLKGKKLLVASIGVAAVSYVGCITPATSGNLVGPPPCDGASCGEGGSGGASPDGGAPDANGPG
jgi:hypothetical protein